MRASISLRRFDRECLDCNPPSLGCIFDNSRTRSPILIKMDVQPSTRPSYSWRWIILLWFGFALVNATQIVAGMRAVGMQHVWSRLFLTVLASWTVWPLATPVVLRLGQRYPFARWRSIRTWAVHLAA